MNKGKDKEMRLRRNPALRTAQLGAVGLCCAVALYLTFDQARLYGIVPSGPGDKASQSVTIPIDRGLLPSLPDDWEGAWRGGTLWITHRNPDGTVADCLPFDGFEEYYDWIETHPDFCDVNVEECAAHVLAPARKTQGTHCERPGQ